MSARLDLPVQVCQGVVEQALVFDCANQALIGVLSKPASSRMASQLGVVIVVGGPQYRIGSHRQFVHLARALAAAGHVALRFDVRGMGDSAGPATDFQAVENDIAAAVDALLAHCPELPGVVLYGLCDGASAALMYVQARSHHPVLGLAVCNPWVRSPTTQAVTQVKHYYMQRLRDPTFWRKLWRGQVARGALADWWRQWRLARSSGSLGTAALAHPARQHEFGSFQERMAAGWAGFQLPVWLLLSEKDYTAREFCEAVASDPAWRGAFERPNLTRLDLAGADHTISDPALSRLAEQSLLAWLDTLQRSALSAGCSSSE